MLDSDAASGVLQFWFEELTTDDWFRQSHDLDDRIKREFGPLHSRAAAGELAGWMSRPDTCLALVVLLDQFSRNIHRGTASATAYDVQARVAANTAVQRGDDRHHWPAGPKRSALYLPFMHSEDLADKRRCVALMREGLVPESVRARAETEAGGNSALNSTITSRVGGANTGGAGTCADSTGLPKLPQKDGARGRTGRKGSVTKEKNAVAAAAAVNSKQANGGSGAKPGEGDEASESDDESDDDSRAPIAGKAASAPSRPNASGGVTHREYAAGSCGGGGAHAYSIQAALEIPKLPVLSLNHEHATCFRTIKLDSQTQQAYMRDKKDVNRTTKYQCLLCAVNHEFRLNKTAGGAEHQHQHA